MRIMAACGGKNPRAGGCGWFSAAGLLCSPWLAGWCWGRCGRSPGWLVGPPVAFIVAVTIAGLTTTDPVTYLQANEPDKAVTQLRHDMPGWRRAARIWPGRFREALANRLVALSEALQAVHHDAEALAAVEEAVAIYQDLAAAQPGKFALRFADALDLHALLLAAAGRQAESLAAMTVAVRLYRNLALTDPGTNLRTLARCLTTVAEWLSDIDQRQALEAASEAVVIYTDRLPGDNLAASHQRHDLLQLAVPAVKAAYRADKDGFLIAWRTETNDELPNWLTS
jgi:tetratricopeptide (TPR) repeat protein